MGKKRRGDFSFERSPLTFRFSKSWFGAQITTTRHFRVIRDVRAEPTVSRTPSSHFAVRVFLFHRGSQFPECCVSLASGRLAARLSDSLAGLVSDAPPSSVAGTLAELRSRFSSGGPSAVPLRVPLPVPLEILSRRSCEFRFRLSDGSCLLSPTGRLLLR